MKTALQTKLSTVAPYILIRTHWSPDPDAGLISQNDDAHNGDDDAIWTAHQAEVRATCILYGEELNNSDYLSGIFERVEMDPASSNPEISGYEAQMTCTALENLSMEIDMFVDSDEKQILIRQIDAALDLISTL
jgi:hypothetical protein